MADVFLSYAREDAPRAELVARGLQQAGLDVFWDNEIPPGQTWADYIESKLTQCKALIVLWSEHSTKSQWVREEARMGRDKGVLIPVMIDNSQPPFGFGEVQAANLAGWQGEADNPNWRRFVDAVMSFAKGDARPAPQPVMSAPPRATAQPSVTAPPVPQTEKKGRVPVWVWVGGAVVATVVALGVIGSMIPQNGGVTPGVSQQVATMPQGAAPQGAAPQQAGANYQQQIADRLTQVQQALAAQGYQQIGQPFFGQLPASQYFNLPPVTLQTGGDYRIVGVCDSDCGDLDLFLYDENNVVVSQDNLTDATPIVSVAPQWTGPFVVQAAMHNCAVSPCYYAVALYGRPIQ